MEPIGQVVIGVDPHKLSATIEVVDHDEQLLGSGRFTTDQAGYIAMRTYARHGPSGSGRSKEPTALEGRWRSGCRVRRAGSRRAGEAGGPGPALRHRSQPQDRRTRRALHRHRRGAHRDITTGQAKWMLATVRPRDIAGKTRRRIAAEELADLVAVEAKIKKSTAELKAIVVARGSRLIDLHSVGPVVAARVLADVGDVTRFARPQPVRLLDRHRTPGRLLR